MVAGSAGSVYRRLVPSGPLQLSDLRAEVELVAFVPGLDERVVAEKDGFAVGEAHPITGQEIDDEKEALYGGADRKVGRFHTIAALRRVMRHCPACSSL
jgi:hypothetical protein